MSPFASALIRVTDDLTVEQYADITGESRASAGRHLKALREDQDLQAITAEAVERLARHEVRVTGASSIAEALKGAGMTSDLSSQDVDPASVRRQMTKADRKNSSLKLELEDLERNGVFDRSQARVLIDKTDAAMKETAAQHGILTKWRRALLRRLQSGS